MSGYNVKGITIEIGANATELSTALNNISRQYSDWINRHNSLNVQSN